jgi:alpha-mannosidase
VRVHDDASQVRQRLAQVLRERVVPAVYRDRRPLSGDVVVRLYASRGSRATASVTGSFPHGAVVEIDLIERPLPEPVCLGPDGAPTRVLWINGAAKQGGDPQVIWLAVRPFRIVTLRFSRS